ncbi:MAG: heme-binding domain-containing protein [Chloroflexota bacterium]
MKKVILKMFLYLLGIFIVFQFFPYGRDHTNPEVTAEPIWDSQTTRDLAVRACFDCHSNETVWPWYSNIAPISWQVYQDVVNGRHELNFSEYGEHKIDIEEIIDEIRDGYMPLPIYLPMHPEARLTDAERAQLIEGLKNTLP